MDRLQIYMDPVFNRRLDEMAHRLHRSKAALIRDGVALLLKEKGPASDEPLMGLKKLAGRSGRRDISEGHDAYLARFKRSHAA